MDYKEGTEAKSGKEFWWLSSLVQLDFQIRLFNIPLLVYLAVGQIILGQNLVVSSLVWCFALDLVWSSVSSSFGIFFLFHSTGSKGIGYLTLLISDSLLLCTVLNFQFRVMNEYDGQYWLSPEWTSDWQLENTLGLSPPRDWFASICLTAPRFLFGCSIIAPS